MSSICRENRHLKKSKPTNAGFQFLSFWVTSVTRPRQENLLRLGQRGISSCRPNGWRCRLAIALHSGTAAQSIHATSKTDSIKFVSHWLLSDSIMYNPDLKGHHWHSSWGFTVYFLNDIPLIPKRLLQGLCLFWTNPMENRVVDWVTGESEVQTHSWAPRREKYWPIVLSRGISMWFPSRFPLLRASMYVMVCNVLQCLQERSEYKRYWVYWLLTWNAMKCLVSLCKTLVWITIDPFWSYLLV